MTLREPLALSWSDLYRQIGADPERRNDRSTVDNFRSKCRRDLEKAKTACPDLRFEIERAVPAKRAGELILYPSRPQVPLLQVVK